MIDQDHRQLLCTFSNNNNFNDVARNIRHFYKLYNNKIFIFSNVKNEKEIFLTYNVIDTVQENTKFPTTISIHRKKQTNTLYSLNALNILIKEEHGCLNHQFLLDWSLYSNSMIISGDVSVRIIPLKLFSVLV